MKDIGLGILDPYTVVIVLITLVLAQVLFGYQIPLDTTNAMQLFIGLAIYSGYIYLARSIFRLPIAFITSWWYLNEEFYGLQIDLMSVSYVRSIGEKIKRFAYLVLLTPSILLALFTISLNFNYSEFAEAFSSEKLNRFREKVWLNYLLGVLDRLSVVAIAAFIVVPNLHNTIWSIGIAGIIVMIFLFLVQGKFAGLVPDNLETVKKILRIEKKKKIKVYSEEPPHTIEQRYGKYPVKTANCVICGKKCTGNGVEKIPRTCSLACSQKWSTEWEKDWCIGSGDERELLNNLRQTGYKDFNEIEEIIRSLVKLKVETSDFNEKPIWTLLAIVRDCDGWSSGYQTNNIHQSIMNAFGEFIKNVELVNILSQGLLDESPTVSEFSANVFAKYQNELEVVDTSKIEPLFYSSTKETRTAAINILKRVKDTNRLLKLLEIGNSIERPKIGKAIVSIGELAIPALQKARNSNDVQISADAAVILDAITKGKPEPIFDNGEFRCPKCGEVLFIKMLDKTVIDDRRIKRNFKWIFAKNKRKTKCSFCNSNVYVTIISEEKWFSNFGLQPSKKQAKVMPLSLPTHIPKLEDDEF